MAKGKKKYSSAEVKAYYMGLGVRLTFTFPPLKMQGVLSAAV